MALRERPSHWFKQSYVLIVSLLFIVFKESRVQQYAPELWLEREMRGKYEFFDLLFIFIAEKKTKKRAGY